MGDFLDQLRTATQPANGENLSFAEMAGLIPLFQNDVEQGKADLDIFLKEDFRRQPGTTIDPSVIGLFWALSRQNALDPKVVGKTDIINETRFAIQDDGILSNAEFQTMTQKASAQAVFGQGDVVGIIKEEIRRAGAAGVSIDVEPAELKEPVAPPPPPPPIPPPSRVSSGNEQEELKRGEKSAEEAGREKSQSGETVVEMEVDSDIPWYLKVVRCLNPFDGVPCREPPNGIDVSWTPPPRIQDEQLQRGEQIVASLADMARHAEKLTEEARTKERDIIKLAYVNERRIRLHGLVYKGKEDLSALAEAVAQGDEPTRTYHFARLTIIYQQATILVQESDNAPMDHGEIVHRALLDPRQRTTVEVEIDPEIPEDDPTESPR